MFSFLTGPMVWISLAVLVFGSAWRVWSYVKGLDWQLDRVAYGHSEGRAFSSALRSILSWLTPFGVHSWREKPGFTIVFFLFHIGIVIAPFFVAAHVMLFQQALGFTWPSFSQPIAHLMCLLVIFGFVFMVLRRLTLPEVRIVTSAEDYVILLITVAPFATGLLAGLHVGDYDFWLLAHIVSGHVMLLAIPFTKLSHMVLFFCSRAQLGMDFGIKRGGMKSTFDW